MTYPVALKRAGGFPLPASTAQNLAGFLSLLNGLLDHPATVTTQAVPSAKRSISPPKEKESPRQNQEKTGTTTVSGIRRAPIRAATSGAIAENPVPIQTGEILAGALSGQAPMNLPLNASTESGGFSQSQLVARQAMGPPSTGSPTPSENHVSSERDMAFALRLTWQAPLANSGAKLATHSSVDSGMPGGFAKNTIVIANHEALPSGSSEIGSHIGPPDMAMMELPAPSPGLGDSQSFQGKDQLAFPGLSFSQSLAPPSPDSRSTVSERDALRSPEVSEPIRPGDSNPNSVPLDQVRSSEADAKLPENDAQSWGFPEGLTPVKEKVLARLSLATYSQDLATIRTEPQAADSALQTVQEESSGAELTKSTSLPRAPIMTNTSAQGSSPEDVGNVAGVPAGAESDRRAPKLQIPEKVSPAPSPNQIPGNGSAGVWTDRLASPGSTLQAQTKTTPPPPVPAAASAEFETSTAIRTQPIREISFRLAADSANVDIQVAQRAGKVQVAVRTSDQQLAQSLQSNLGELVGHLEDKGFKTETWSPLADPHSAVPVWETSNSAHSQSHTDDSGYRSGQQNQGQGQQQESNQRHQGRWKAQLQETFSGPVEPNYEEEEP